MKDYFLRMIRRHVGSNLIDWRNRFKGVGTKKRNILIIIVLLLCTRLFFYAFFDNFAQAEKPMKIDNVDEEIIDPMNKIKKEDSQEDKKNKAKLCFSDKKLGKKDIYKPEEKMREEEYREMVKGYPLEEMVPFIARKDEKTAAFLIGIAKKESDWGKHAPRKGDRSCYNYWGYKGSYNLVQGYSCFDSPEHAIEIVGGKIDSLINKNIDTPERMVVWKCGSSCAGHSPESVRSWIGAVRTYWQRILS
ncbi:MAG TPA: hypothetical protein PLK35_03230 [Candidatus Moranbacteria bacterium]|nr:hypothetical protein [Candidatus Moranbacteria bacterium]